MSIRAELKMNAEPRNKLQLPEWGYKATTSVLQHVSPSCFSGFPRGRGNWAQNPGSMQCFRDQATSSN